MGSQSQLLRDCATFTPLSYFQTVEEPCCKLNQTPNFIFKKIMERKSLKTSSLDEYHGKPLKGFKLLVHTQLIKKANKTRTKKKNPFWTPLYLFSQI
jgi:hypothetical protein